MRRIVKGPEPEALRCWKERNAAVPQNLTYANMPKAPVKLQMLTEQGYLCAYTMQRIQTVDDCHIEHVVPRNQTHRTAHLDIDYTNLLACAPSNTPGHRPKEHNFPYGAPKKGGTPVDDDNFISPLREDVEDRFRYGSDGTVAPAADDPAATSTINMLQLDHAQLKELRKAAIDERVLNRGLSADDAETLSRTVMMGSPAGRLPEFCLAISQVAAWYANRMRNID